jgi:hypothetical protein
VLVLIDAIAHVVLLLVELSLFPFGKVTIVSRHIGLLLILDMLFAVLET